jgi:ribosomal protein S18 acetylase RimI-like enzyme
MYLQEWIQVGKKRERLVIRRYTAQDFNALIGIQRECFPPPFPEDLLWTNEQLHEHVTRFPEGAVCVEIDSQLIGSITTLITQYNKGDLHSWSEVTDNGSIRNHNKVGNSLYVVDISVRPRYRSLGIGRRLLHMLFKERLVILSFPLC